MQDAGWTYKTACPTPQTTANPLMIQLGDNQNHYATAVGANNGLVQLDQLLNRTAFPSKAYSEGYGRSMVALDVSDLGTPTSSPLTGPYHWYYANCLAVLPPTGFLVPYPCEFSLPPICQYDFTQFVCQPGMCCDDNGDSARNSPANPGLTCNKDFDLSSDQIGAAAALLLGQGYEMPSSLEDAVYALAQQSLRAQTNDLFWLISNASAQFALQTSTLYGRTTPQQSADLTYGTDFAPQQIWPTECGQVASLETGQTYLRVASDSTQCSVFASSFPSRPFSDVPLAL